MPSIEVKNLENQTVGEIALADGVFETMRVTNGTIFRGDRHLARLTHALATLAIPKPATLESWLVTITVRTAQKIDERSNRTAKRGESIDRPTDDGERRELPADQHAADPLTLVAEGETRERLAAALALSWPLDCIQSAMALAKAV
mgnify:CR=1 FL=1